MILAFQLNMANTPTWNGKWSGEGNYYARTKNMGRSKVATEKAQSILDNQPYWHTWSDGWSCNIGVRQVDSIEAKKIRKRSDGFCGYDQFIGYIIEHGKIVIPTTN